MANQPQNIAVPLIQGYVKMTIHGFTLWYEVIKGNHFHPAPHENELVRK